MIDAIRKRVSTFAAIIALFVVAVLVGGYILSQERLTLPGWVPIFGRSFFVLNADFSTAQAVTPGQGQEVTIAGVKVGQISGVSLSNGQGVVSMQIEPKYAAIYRNATALLRPRTPLQDMDVELTPGDPTTGKLRSGDTIPIDSTLPDINADEILSALDGDSREYLELLLSGGGQGLSGQGASLGNDFRRFDPTVRDLALINVMLAQRRSNLARVVHNFQLLATALGSKDRQLASLVSSSDVVFQSFADQDAALRQSLALLPGGLSQTQTTLTKVDALAKVLGPTAQALEPTAVALAPALRATRPFLRGTTPVIANQLRPFTRAALPATKQLRPAAADLAAILPNLFTSLGVINQALNELAFNPGSAKPGYLFYLAWANHDADSIFATQDANGPIRRGVLLSSCESIGLLNQVAAVNPSLQLLVGLLMPPAQACPTASGAP